MALLSSDFQLPACASWIRAVIAARSVHLGRTAQRRIHSRRIDAWGINLGRASVDKVRLIGGVTNPLQVVSFLWALHGQLLVGGIEIDGVILGSDNHAQLDYLVNVN